MTEYALQYPWLTFFLCLAFAVVVVFALAVVVVPATLIVEQALLNWTNANLARSEAMIRAAKYKAVECDEQDKAE